MLGEGKQIPDAAKELGISEATFHRWRNPTSCALRQRRTSRQTFPGYLVGGDTPGRP